MHIYIGLYYYLMMDYSQIDLMLTCACQQNQTSGVKPWFMSHKIYYRISGYGSLITVKKSSKIWQGWVKVCGCPWIWLSECFHQFTLSWSCPWLYKHVHMSGVPGCTLSERPADLDPARPERLEPEMTELAGVGGLPPSGSKRFFNAFLAQ